MHLHSQTSRTDTNRLHKSTSCPFISQKTLRQHKLPDFCHHLICPTVPRSEARTCRLLIVAEERTSNPTPKMLTKLLPILLPTHYFLPKKNRPFQPPSSTPPILLLSLPFTPPCIACISSYLSSFQLLLASS
jgi:hypothetical protein